MKVNEGKRPKCDYNYTQEERQLEKPECVSSQYNIFSLLGSQLMLECYSEGVKDKS